MGEIKSLETVVRVLTDLDSSYAPEAYFLIRDTVTFAQSRQEVHRHLTAGELVDYLIEFASGEYGPLARPVLAEWGLLGPDDVGKIVYKLIGAGILSASPEDRPEDFQVLKKWFPEDAMMTEYLRNFTLPKIDL